MKPTKRDPVRDAERDLFDAAIALAFGNSDEAYAVDRVKRCAERLLRASFLVRHRRPRAKAKRGGR